MPSARVSLLRVVQRCLDVVFCTVEQSGHSEDTRTALPKMVGTEYIIKRWFIIYRKKKELVLVFLRFTELHLHRVFPNCFFLLSFVYPEVEISLQLNIVKSYFLKLYYTCKSGRLHCLILGLRCLEWSSESEGTSSLLGCAQAVWYCRPGVAGGESSRQLGPKGITGWRRAAGGGSMVETGAQPSLSHLKAGGGTPSLLQSWSSQVNACRSSTNSLLHMIPPTQFCLCCWTFVGSSAKCGKCSCLKGTVWTMSTFCTRTCWCQLQNECWGHGRVVQSACALWIR